MVPAQARRELVLHSTLTFLALADAATSPLLTHPGPGWGRQIKRLQRWLVGRQEDAGCLLQPDWALLYVPTSGKNGIMCREGIVASPDCGTQDC